MHIRARLALTRRLFSSTTFAPPKTILSCLRARGLIGFKLKLFLLRFVSHVHVFFLDALTLPDDKFEVFLEKPTSVYAGFDPTADSLHLGNLLVMQVLAHFQQHGHRPICVVRSPSVCSLHQIFRRRKRLIRKVGGATGMIGDPSGRSSERSLLDAAAIEKNIAGISGNLTSFFERSHLDSVNPAESSSLSAASPSSPSPLPQLPAPLLLNNHDWYRSLNVIDFLRDCGKHFRVGVMLSKDSVKKFASFHMFSTKKIP